MQKAIRSCRPKGMVVLHELGLRPAASIQGLAAGAKRNERSTASFGSVDTG